MLLIILVIRPPYIGWIMIPKLISIYESDNSFITFFLFAFRYSEKVSCIHFQKKRKTWDSDQMKKAIETVL